MVRQLVALGVGSESRQVHRGLSQRRGWEIGGELLNVIHVVPKVALRLAHFRSRRRW